MQSSYNVIKNSLVISQGNKEIVTNVDNKRNKYLNEEYSDLEIEKDGEAASDLIKEATRQSEEIITNARAMSSIIEKEAYNNGYEAGSTEGYREAYEKTLKEAQVEAMAIIGQANDMLLKAKLEYEDYIEANKRSIIQLSINMAENVLKRELKLPDGLNEIILEVLGTSKSSDSFIIKIGKLYIDELKTHIKDWQDSLGLKGEIFILVDETVGVNNAVIEKSNGRIEIGLDAGMEGIKKALL